MLCKGYVDLGAQTPDRDFNNIGIAVEVHVPNLFSNLRSRENFALSSQKQYQQQKLLGSQVQALTASGRLTPHQVDFKVGQPQLRGLNRIPCTVGTSEQNLDAGAQLGKCEGLDQIVVSACLKA